MMRRMKNSAIKTTTWAWIVWSTSAVFLLFQFFLQLSSAVIIGGLMKSFTLTALGASILASSYYYVYVSLQAPAGALVDRFGTRKLLALGAFVCGIGCIIFSQSIRLWVAFPARLIMGTGAAFAFVGSLNIIARWFPIQRFALMVAIAETLGMFGAIFGNVFLAYLVIHFGWRHCLFGAGILALIISVLLWTIIRDSPDGQALPLTPETNFWRDIKSIVKRREAWINGIYSGLMFSIVTAFVALWAVPFLEATYHLTLTMAAFVSNLVFIGVAVGGPVIGWIDTRFSVRRATMITGPWVAAVVISLIIYIPQLPLGIVILLMLLLGFAISTYVLTFVVANEIVPGYMRSTSVGFVNMLSVGGAPVLQPLIGFLLASTHQFQIALSICMYRPLYFWSPIIILRYYFF
jgi:MFS family permease